VVACAALTLLMLASLARPLLRPRAPATRLLPAARASTTAAMAQQPNPSDVLVVYCTVPDASAADAVAGAVVGARLAACVNVVPGLTSIYRWKGKIERDSELLLLMKTTAGRLDALTAAVKAAHPYDVPEVLAVPAAGGSADYLRWVADETAAEVEEGKEGG
jgi:periplasmic divalent cation tolerance protein